MGSALGTVGYLARIFEESRFYACSIKEPPEILHYIGDENSVMCEKCLKLRNEHGKTTSFEPCLSTCERPAYGKPKKLALQ